jgi:hypothetical protein
MQNNSLLFHLYYKVFVCFGMGRRWRFWEDFSQEIVFQELRINFKLFWRPKSGEADKIEIIETSVKSPKIPQPKNIFHQTQACEANLHAILTSTNGKKFANLNIFGEHKIKLKIFSLKTYAVRECCANCP